MNTFENRSSHKLRLTNFLIFLDRFGWCRALDLIGIANSSDQGKEQPTSCWHAVQLSSSSIHVSWLNRLGNSVTCKRLRVFTLLWSLAFAVLNNLKLCITLIWNLIQSCSFLIWTTFVASLPSNKFATLIFPIRVVNFTPSKQFLHMRIISSDLGELSLQCCWNLTKMGQFFHVNSFCKVVWPT